jgi:hypothetical protein
MAGESTKETAEDQMETLIDDLISEIFSSSGTSSDPSMRGMATTAALLETAFGSTRSSKVSVFERLFLAQAFATELADALAPALAEQLAPRLLKSLEELMANGAGKRPTPGASRSNVQSRKSETK